jgi:hypothetical protein
MRPEIAGSIDGFGMNDSDAVAAQEFDEKRAKRPPPQEGV